MRITHELVLTGRDVSVMVQLLASAQREGYISPDDMNNDEARVLLYRTSVLEVGDDLSLRIIP